MVNDTPRQWHKNQGQTWDWHFQGQGHTHSEATGLWSRTSQALAARDVWTGPCHLGEACPSPVQGAGESPQHIRQARVST